MGRSAGPHRVRLNDKPSKVDEHWAALRGAFCDSNVVLLYHLKNHYALIYAMREWSERADNEFETKKVRQVLTARKGQRPSAWIDFSEVHDLLARARSYCIMEVRRKS